jgi:hypothetical protein
VISDPTRRIRRSAKEGMDCSIRPRAIYERASCNAAGVMIVAGNAWIKACTNKHIHMPELVFMQSEKAIG